MSQAAPPELCAATLCLDRETAEVVKKAVARKNGIFAGELDEYTRFNTDMLLLQKLQRSEVPIWVIGFDRDRAAAVTAANAIQQSLHGRGNLIAVSDKSDPDLILEAMRAGCSEYLTRRSTVDQLAEALDRVRSRLNVQKPVSAKPLGRILAMLGARGGAGATTLAVHLGCFLVSSMARRRSFSTSIAAWVMCRCIWARMRPTITSMSWCRTLRAWMRALLQGFVIHHSSRLDILPSPDCLRRLGQRFAGRHSTRHSLPAARITNSWSSIVRTAYIT